MVAAAARSWRANKFEIPPIVLTAESIEMLAVWAVASVSGKSVGAMEWS